MSQALLQSPDGSESAPRWFGAVCIAAAIGIVVLNAFKPMDEVVELVKAFLYPGVVSLGSAKVAEALKK